MMSHVFFLFVSWSYWVVLLEMYSRCRFQIRLGGQTVYGSNKSVFTMAHLRGAYLKVRFLQPNKLTI